MILELKNITSPYIQLRDISFSLDAGDFLVITGENGSGKSTILKILDGHCMDFKGSIQKPENIFLIQQHIDQNIFTNLTLYENFKLFNPNITLDRIKEIFSIIHPKFMDKLNQNVASFSGGEKQMVILALVAARPVDLLLLDEPTSALSPEATEKMMAALRQIVQHYKITTIMVTHDHRYKDFGNRHMVF